jgi:hypothetical protein
VLLVAHPLDDYDGDRHLLLRSRFELDCVKVSPRTRDWLSGAPNLTWARVETAAVERLGTCMLQYDQPNVLVALAIHAQIQLWDPGLG